jgi:hypothetical protein
MADEEFWGSAGQDRGESPEQGGAAPDDGMVTPGAQTALVGFMTGGLPGLLGALDARGGASFEDDVEDPEALRRAEEAVSGRPTPAAVGGEPIDESWSVVATQDSASDSTGLDDVARSLESDGIDHGWDPYDPRDTVNFLPPSAGLTARKLFSIVVPRSQFARARESLYGAPPQGVTYAWSDTRIGAAVGAVSVTGATAGPGAAADSDAGFDSGIRATPAPTGPADPRLSDNQRLERLSGGGMPSGVVIVVLAFLLIGGAVAAFLLTRG